MNNPYNRSGDFILELQQLHGIRTSMLVKKQPKSAGIRAVPGWMMNLKFEK